VSAGAGGLGGDGGAAAAALGALTAAELKFLLSRNPALRERMVASSINRWLPDARAASRPSAPAELAEPRGGPDNGGAGGEHEDLRISPEDEQNWESVSNAWGGSPRPMTAQGRQMPEIQKPMQQHEVAVSLKRLLDE
jgi:hypothetical protein